MPSISDKLKSMGVQLGKENLPQPKRANYPIEKIMDGEIISTPAGEVFVVESTYPLDHPHGGGKLNLTARMEMIAEWARDKRVKETSLEGFAFIDTETTGLAGGSGTYAFMIGVGRFEGQQFRLAQYFMRDPAEEPAQLTALEHFLAPCQTIVTFNGKSFDIPLLEARYITNGAPPPLKDAAHLDLLHLARRLWRERLPSRTLGYLEEHIIGETRTEEDTPGFMIPQMYFDYLHSGDARPLKGVFYHNVMDILTMVTLTERMAFMLEEPFGGQVEHALDLLAVGKLYEDLGYWEKASQIYTHSLDEDLTKEYQLKNLQRLATLQKRRGELPEALSLWWQAAADREIYAHEELAKYYEHQARDYEEAKKWTEAALAILRMPDTPKYEKVQWEEQLKYRLARLERKLAREQVRNEKT